MFFNSGFDDVLCAEYEKLKKMASDAASPQTTTAME